MLGRLVHAPVRLDLFELGRSTQYPRGGHRRLRQAGDDPRLPPRTSGGGRLADHVHQAGETSDVGFVPGLAPLLDAGRSRPQQQAVALRPTTKPDRQSARPLGLSPNRFPAAPADRGRGGGQCGARWSPHRVPAPPAGSADGAPLQPGAGRFQPRQGPVHPPKPRANSKGRPRRARLNGQP